VPNYLHATAYGGVKLQGHALITSALDTDAWSASRPCPFAHEERATLPMLSTLTAPEPVSETKSQLLDSAVAIPTEPYRSAPRKVAIILHRVSRNMSHTTGYISQYNHPFYCVSFTITVSCHITWTYLIIGPCITQQFMHRKIHFTKAYHISSNIQ
jgi:hypothetical protein